MKSTLYSAMKGFWPSFYNKQVHTLKTNTRQYQDCPFCKQKNTFHWYEHSAAVGAGYCKSCGIIPDGFNGLARLNCSIDDLQSFLGEQYLGYALDTSSPSAAFAQLFNDSLPAFSTPAFQEWTESIGLYQGEVPETLRWLPSVPSYKDSIMSGSTISYRPFLLAPVTDTHENLTTLSGMYLDGSHTLWPSEDTSGIIRMYECNSNVLLITETITDMLLARSVTGQPVWCCLNAEMLTAGIEHLKLLDSVDKVILLARNHSLDGDYNSARRDWLDTATQQGIPAEILVAQPLKPQITAWLDMGLESVQKRLELFTRIEQPTISESE